MSWSNNGGGGPWRPGNPGPWGQGPGSSGGGGGTPPDLEEFIRRSQQRIRGFLPGGSLGGFGAAAVALVAVLLWLATGFYTVAPNEVGLNLVFGRYTGNTAPGLNYNLPYPVGDVIKLAVTDRNAVDVGFASGTDPRRSSQLTSSDVPQESLMLTGDDNIADVKFRVIWQIDPEHPEYYAFNIRRPDETVKAVAESAMREVIGRSQIQNILTSGRKTIEPEVQNLIQSVLDGYKAGVTVLQVQLLSVDPPAQVIAAFRDVTAAQQDQQRLSNEAQAYANKVVPEARGAAVAIQQEAEGYKTQVVQEAQGQASRFDQIYAQYKNAPGVTRERIYIETMEAVLAGADKTVIDKGGAGVLPVLPLDGSAKPLAGAGGRP